MDFPYINRELSWLDFNQRVLSEALRDDLPLLERVKFLAITGSNLDEFYQVRVGGLMLLRRSGRKTPDPSGMTPVKNLAAIRERAGEMVDSQYKLLNETLLPLLRGEGIVMLATEDLSVIQQSLVAAIFEDELLPMLTPLAVDPADGVLNLPALQLIVACLIKDSATGETRHALVPVPDALPRRIQVSTPDDAGYHFLPISSVIASHAGRLFPDEAVRSTAVFRVTKNGDIAVREEDTLDLADEMEDVLAARKYSDSVRLELQAKAPRELATMIRRITGSTSQEIQIVDGEPGIAGWMELAFLENYDQLRPAEWTPQPSPAISPGVPIFDAISRGDILLHHPYESFEPVLRFIEEAAEDPDVIAIKQVLYRTAKNSRIIKALIRAAENGKQVTTLIELKARFDEKRNLEGADDLQRAGAQIVYGVKGLKTHAKICLILRREAGRLRRYVHLGTGNYNEATSRLYTDISFLTGKAEYGSDASLFFNAVTGRSKLLRFQKLVPAPTAMKPRLLELIDGEAERARQGLPARIMAKMNSLQDPEIIAALYLASRAGVEILLNVRGICCLKPGDPEFSKKIRVVSIIDRYLEHTRMFQFLSSGDVQLFISSADWMTRNLEKRIELMIPIEQPVLKRRLGRILETYFLDNSQAFEILPDGTSRRVRRKRSEKPVRAQENFYQLARRAAKAREHERSMTFEPHVPVDE